MTANEPSSNTSKIIIVIASLLVISALGFFAFNYFKQKELNRQHQIEEDQLTTDIVNLERQILDFRIENESQQEALLAKESELSLAKVEIDRLQKKLSQTKQNSSELSDRLGLMEKRLSNLELMITKYQAQVKNLIAENIALKKANSSLEEANDASEKKVESLEEQLDKKDDEIQLAVEKGSKLVTSELEFYKMDKKGNVKEKPDNSFSKFWFGGVRACFKIFENEVTRSGQRDVYLVLENPDGSINTNIKEGYSGTFKAGGVSKLYSSRLTFNYDNRKINLCLDYKASEDIKFERGLYLVRVFSDDGNQIVMGQFELK